MRAKNSRTSTAALKVEYTNRPVSGWGRLLIPFLFVERIGLPTALSEALPDGRTSLNQVPALDLDSTVFESYGQQDGSLKGHNPRKHGRPSRHPLLAILARCRRIVHVWLRSGNAGPLAA